MLLLIVAMAKLEKDNAACSEVIHCEHTGEYRITYAMCSVESV